MICLLFLNYRELFDSYDFHRTLSSAETHLIQILNPDERPTWYNLKVYNNHIISPIGLDAAQTSFFVTIPLPPHGYVFLMTSLYREGNIVISHC